MYRSKYADFSFPTGDDQQIDALREILDAESIFARKLATGVAYHSPHMQQIADDYLSAMGSLELGDQPMGCQTMVSSVSTLQRRSSHFRQDSGHSHHTKQYNPYVALQQVLYHKAMLTQRFTSGDEPKCDIKGA